MSIFFSRTTDYESLRASVERERSKLLSHRLYQEVDSLERLRVFMQVHVFAVWDFMSLAKRLQRELTCVELPWRPPSSPVLSRFANEVILAEESDVDPDGVACSHLELYLNAMREIGASTSQFEYFLSELSDGLDVQAALKKARVPKFIRSFVLDTIETAVSAEPVAVLSSFLFGREDLIPEMFDRLLPACASAGAGVSHFDYYLRRHIELDGDEHGPVARSALTAIASGHRGNWRLAERAARRALVGRLRLWDGVCALLAADSDLAFAAGKRAAQIEIEVRA